MPDRTNDQPQAKRRPARSKAQVRPTTEFYVIQIDRWDWSFSFGVNPSRKHFPEPYSDYRHLEVHGRLLRPKAAKAEMAGLTFLPRLNLDLAAVADLPSSMEPRAVGSAHVRAGAFQGLLSMSHDVLAPLLTALAAGQLRYVTLDGEPLFRGQATIRRFSFQSAYDPDDLPAEAGRAR
ncbi:hypothetical protein ACQW02_26765 [Humitalea sp. 24SJ18S-53]|uniref:hypothetical protein n=1 Tax=Humitalea sp. 24SJ18S-53 TaxID=3422307 RepID=UPI003D671F82